MGNSLAPRRLGRPRNFHFFGDRNQRKDPTSAKSPRKRGNNHGASSAKRIRSKARLGREIEASAHIRAESLFGHFKGPDGGHQEGRWWPLRGSSTVLVGTTKGSDKTLVFPKPFWSYPVELFGVFCALVKAHPRPEVTKDEADGSQTKAERREMPTRAF